MIALPNAKVLSRRLLAIAAILALALLATHAVSHWHSHAYNEDSCQLCHVGHAAVPQPAAQVATLAPAPVARFAVDDETAPHLDFVSTSSIPRPPPA